MGRVFSSWKTAHKLHTCMPCLCTKSISRTGGKIIITPYGDVNRQFIHTNYKNRAAKIRSEGRRCYTFGGDLRHERDGRPAGVQEEVADAEDTTTLQCRRRQGRRRQTQRLHQKERSHRPSPSNNTCTSKPQQT